MQVKFLQNMALGEHSPPELRLICQLGWKWEGSRCKREGKMKAKHKPYRSPDDAASCKSKVDICSKAQTEPK
jgi:hypothetical protein